MGTPLYTCKISPFLVSRFAIISEFSCTVDDCCNIDSKEATRIYKRENIHCLKLPPESWALDERQSITYNITYNSRNEVDHKLVKHYLLGLLELMLCIILGTCIYKIRNKVLGLSKNTNTPTYYHATENLN
jgi:hypothetical protein